MAVVVSLAEMAVSVGWVAVSWVDDASVIGDASLGGAGVSANDADEGVWAVGIAAYRICADRAEGQSARSEKSGQRYFD
jgi:hypothetical protein